MEDQNVLIGTLDKKPGYDSVQNSPCVCDSPSAS